jgi:hypothetical protein
MSKIGFPEKVLGKTKICEFRFFEKSEQKSTKTINPQKDLKPFWQSGFAYSTVTTFARFLGLSGLIPFSIDK